MELRDIPRERLINLLKEQFSIVSEDYWSAGWSINLEYDLWSDAMFLRNNIGVMHDSKINDSEKLQRNGADYVNAILAIIVLSDHLGGWLYFPDDMSFHGEQFIEKEEWMKMYAENKEDHHM